MSNPELRALAAHCDSVCAELVGSIPAPSVGPPSQATSAAVATGYTRLSTTTGVLAGRVATTGAKLCTAGVLFVTEDEWSAERIDTVGRSAGV